MVVFLEGRTTIVTENVDGDMYIISEKYLQDILDDWNGDCNFVPENDARVFFASWNDDPINPHLYKDFGTLMEFLRAKLQ